MKLFELYQQNTLQGTNNLKRISEAVENKTAAVITVGNTQIKLGINSARYVFGLYETAVANGTSEQFLEGLANLNPTMVMENDNTMRHIVGKFKHEVKNFLAGQELSDDLYHALFDYYSDHGEMPYGVQKARDGDPYEWVHMRFDRDVHDYAGGGNPDIPALPAATMPSMPRQESMYEAKNPWLDLGKDDRSQEKNKKSISTGDIEYTKKGLIHRSKKEYGGKWNTDYSDIDGTASDTPQSKGSVGTPGKAFSSTEDGIKFNDYASWYHKSKRKHMDRRILGSINGAVAVIPQGNKFIVVGEWDKTSGMLFNKPDQVMSSDELSNYQAGRGRRLSVPSNNNAPTTNADDLPPDWARKSKTSKGGEIELTPKGLIHRRKDKEEADDKKTESMKFKGRPKKIREWIETLRFMSEGETTKTATGIKHTAKGKYGASEDKPEDDKLDKTGTNRIDKALGIKWKKQGWGKNSNLVLPEDTGKFDVKKTATGTQYTRKSSTYDDGGGSGYNNYKVASSPKKKYDDENEREYNFRDDDE
jgi:hypothetical protein